MHFECNFQESGRKKVLGDKQTTNNLPLMFLDRKLRMER